MLRLLPAITAISLPLTYTVSHCDSLSRSQREAPTLSPQDYGRFLTRTFRTVLCVSSIVAHYKLSPSSKVEERIVEASEKLSQCQKVYTEPGSGGGGGRSKEDQRSDVLKAAEDLAILEDRHRLAPASVNKHRWAAEKILRLCRENKGCYIKIGQHLANLDYLLPAEFTMTLQELYNESPVSPYSEICELVHEELGRSPDEAFASFDPTPIASASLAQVHTAVDKKTSKKIAVKVQHPSVALTARGDIYVLASVVKFLEQYFDEFTFGWLVDEIAPQIFKELDFNNEARNTRRAKKELEAEFKSKVCVPEILGDYSTSRVMTMSFEDGVLASDTEGIERGGLKKEDVSSLISSIFAFQVFSSGFVHCDPHPANVLVRQHPTTNEAQIILLDHGLYKRLGESFRKDYANLWASIVLAEVDLMKKTCEKFGVGQAYPLLAAIITSRPFDEILDRRRGGIVGKKVKRTKNGKGDKAMIRKYAERYMQEILHLLETVPRDLLLLLKMNDCLRHINSVLKANNNRTMEIQASWAIWGERGRWSEGMRRWAYGWYRYLSGRLRIYLLFATLRWQE